MTVGNICVTLGTVDDRIYFGQEGDELVILLGGGAKKTQQKDIQIAHTLWAEYKQVRAKKK